MEVYYYAYLSYIVLLFLLPFSLYLIASPRKQASENSKSLPPGSKGWPLLGENMAFAFSGPSKFIKDRMEKYSPDVFRTSLLGENVAVFCRVQGNRFLFSNEDKVIRLWLPKSIRKALFFPEYTENHNLKELGGLFHRFRNDILKPEALKQYVSIMDEVARKHLDSEWAPDSVVKVFHLSKKYMFHLACRLFMGLVEPERVQKLAEPFTLVTSGLISMPIDFPGTAYNRAIKGGSMVREELLRIIEERRRELTEKKERVRGSDFLSKMLLATDEDGRFFSEREISNNIIAMLVASFDSTSSALSSVISYLAELPHIYDEVFKEQMEIVECKGPDEFLTWEDIEKMKYSWNVVRECLRLMPASQGNFREATTEFTFAGCTIPKGWKIFWTVHSSHKDPEYFPEPEKFDPSRFEGSGPTPYAFVPFGGGPRVCPGREYARLGVLVFMHNVVRRFKLKKTVPNEKIVFYASAVPVHGLPVHLQPHDYNK